jgi:hypothetical protein
VLRHCLAPFAVVRVEDEVRVPVEGVDLGSGLRIQEPASIEAGYGSFLGTANVVELEALSAIEARLQLLDADFSKSRGCVVDGSRDRQGSPRRRW